MSLSFGIDAGGSSVALCAVDPSGKLTGETLCDCGPHVVIKAIQDLGGSLDDTVGIEAGGCGLPLTRKLRQAGYQVRVLDTRYVSRFLKVRQNKTDTNDARGIAEMVRLGASTVPDVLIKAEAIQILRSELVLRHRLMGQRVALENAVRGTLRINGSKLPRIYSSAHLDRALRDELAQLRAGGTDLRPVLGPLATILVDMRKALEQANRRLARICSELEVTERFASIPGVGTICALSFYTAIEDPHRFAKATDVGPYLGLVPRITQSGATRQSGRITRAGNTMTRTHLVTAAGSMMRQANKDNALRQWAIRLRERAGYGKARVALARKLATVMLAMWKSGEPFKRGLA